AAPRTDSARPDGIPSPGSPGDGASGRDPRQSRGPAQLRRRGRSGLRPTEPLLGGVYAGLPQSVQTSHRRRLGPHRAGRGTGRTLANSSRLSDQCGPHLDVLVHRSVHREPLHRNPAGSVPESSLQRRVGFDFQEAPLGLLRRTDRKATLSVDDRFVGARDVRGQDRDAHREELGPDQGRCGDRPTILNRAEEHVRGRARRSKYIGGVHHADTWPLEIPELRFEVFRLETEDELEGPALEREGRDSNRLLQICLVRLLGEAGPEDDELPGFQAEARPGGGSLLVGRRREPGYVDPPADAANASRWEAELEEAPAVRFRKRYDDVEARKTRQQHDIVQGSIAMIRGCGQGHWDLAADCPE